MHKSKSISSRQGVISADKYSPGNFVSMNQYMVREPGQFSHRRVKNGMPGTSATKAVVKNKVCSYMRPYPICCTLGGGPKHVPPLPLVSSCCRRLFRVNFVGRQRGGLRAMPLRVCAKESSVSFGLAVRCWWRHWSATFKRGRLVIVKASLRIW